MDLQSIYIQNAICHVFAESKELKGFYGRNTFKKTKQKKTLGIHVSIF